MSKERAKRGTLPPAQEKVVEEGNYHGAQQLYKSISARYVAAQRYTEALDILQSGACIQLKHGQVTCGAELAALFVDTLVKARCPYDDETLGQLLASSVKHRLPPVHPSLFSVASAGAPSVYFFHQGRLHCSPTVQSIL
ncbi:hypothetical protein RchiOBHm_Chr2g0153331 [Rosa chinensis]|uniref:Tetratricopeptide-like helical domain-containing protein n=1 Tax=Rosa chinensis TaxID=74649 RepID=A0A2P6S0Q0_ROSCH|nr:hypothetical protein RchiOBHm_Chr2g0153331 [Rosa chinensis]